MLVIGNGVPGTSCVGTPLSPVTAAVTAPCATAGAHINVTAPASAATSLDPAFMPAS